MYVCMIKKYCTLNDSLFCSIKLVNFYFSFQIGNLNDHYLFLHHGIHKRSTDPSSHHHSLLSEHPEVREATVKGHVCVVVYMYFVNPIHLHVSGF